MHDSSTQRLCWMMLISMLMLTTSGCGGCRNNGEADPDDSNTGVDGANEPFSFENVKVLPAGQVAERDAVKPGHWMTANQQVTSRIRDEHAVMESKTSGFANRKSENLRDFPIVTSRPVSLPKGQTKELESLFYVPRSDRSPISFNTNSNVPVGPGINPGGAPLGVSMGSISIDHQLMSRSNGRPLLRDANLGPPNRLMKPYQYFFVVLTDEPDAYRKLKDLSCIRLPADFGNLENLFYRLCLSQQNARVVVPSSIQSWTSVAYLLWDDYDASLLSDEQQQAMVDWLHWGGQLIVSGPDSLEQLRGSFLGPYLPATVLKAVNLEQASFEKFNDAWTIDDGDDATDDGVVVSENNPVMGVELQVTEGSGVVANTGELVYEKKCGRGRVVATAFSIRDERISLWSGFDSFLNSCLMNKPNRQFHKTMHQFNWVNLAESNREPRIATGVRFFSRDVERLLGVGSNLPSKNVVLEYASEDRRNDFDRSELLRDWFVRGSASDSQSGVGGWNDASGVSMEVREILKDAAGIEPPSALFVAKTLLVYLVVLVPLNWAFFRLIGRVEWAWAAAPVIAVVCSVVVVKMAELDVGFSRSRTEVSVLELYEGYSRGHLTRYTALYSSLSTDFDVKFEDSSTVAQPMIGFGNEIEVGNLIHEKGVTLEDFHVKSVSTGFYHSEEMCKLDGPIHLVQGPNQSLSVSNSTQLDLQDVGVLQRTSDNQYQVAWVGELGSGDSKSLSFRDVRESMRLENWDQSDVTMSTKMKVNRWIEQYDLNQDNLLSRDEVASNAELTEFFEVVQKSKESSAVVNSGATEVLDFRELREISRRIQTESISLGGLFDLAATVLTLGRDEVRLIGWTDNLLPGMSIQPRASQSTGKTLVLTHLRRAQTPDPIADLNLPFVDPNFDVLEEELILDNNQPFRR